MPRNDGGPLVSVAPATLLALRGALLTRADLETVIVLRDAGYAGGEVVYDAFRAWAERELGADDVQVMPFDSFAGAAGRFLTDSGWGDVTVTALEDAFCVVDITRCWEAVAEHQPEPRGCHLTTGLLGAFLGQFADYPVAVLEVEGPATGSERSRFLAGGTEMISRAYETLAAGGRYSDLVAA